MMMSWRVLAVTACLLAAVAADLDADDDVGWSESVPRWQRARASAPAPAAALTLAPAERWLKLLSDYARTAGAGSDELALPRPIPVNLPLGRGEDGRSISLPVLILPVPVPAPAPERKASSQCSDAKLQSVHEEAREEPLKERGGGGRGAQAQAQAQAQTQTSARPFPRHSEEPTVPHLDYVVSSQQLVELFQAQVAPDPELPPAVIPDYGGGTGAGSEPEPDLAAGDAPSQRRKRLARLRSYQLPSPGSASHAYPSAPAPAPPAYASARSASAPPRPRFDRSLMLRGVLTVPRAGYSEPYTVWWEAESGAARVDLHGGATSTYRTLMPDGRVRYVEMRTDRSDANDVRRCAASATHVPSPGDRALPALPDLQAFAFTGYVESEFGRVERWAHTVSGGAGELGGARGEALAFRHELLLARAPDNSTTTPLRYSVSVDSSTLGAACDGYVHRYSELRDQRHEPGFFVLDLVESCDEVQAGTAPRERVEPLREFTMSHRDPRYDALYNQFKAAHARLYWDDAEEAVRKNLLVQHSRFVNSGNRQGATFSMEMNHLSDRLDLELGVLRGVREEALAAPSEPFPHDRAQLAASRARLPTNFDWRLRGAVTPVRNQGSCSSCWAFAVVGAVEGALFLRTRTLVPLSEQCLVDCAHPFGGHGCGGTWPSAAYEYVQARGLPALSDYPPYKEKVGQCTADSVPPVTHISAHVNVTRNDVNALKVAIRRHAPTVVIIDSSPKSFIFYKKGVINDERCAKNKAEHAVLAVGWGSRRGGEEHILVKNSWSAAWGDAGYVRLQARSNTCGVLSRPSYPRLERPDVDRLPAAAPAA